MRIRFIILLLFISFRMFSQSPGLINYQGVVRDDKGTPVISQPIALRFEILQGSTSGAIVYTEDQLTGISTNNLGLFTTQIGKNGNLSQVDWQQNQTYYLRILLDPTGGSNLQTLGTPQQIASVPYALHASSVPATYTNNVLSVGNKTFNISSTPNTSLTVSGIGTVTSIGTNSFDINVPAPTFSNSGQTIITGTFPDFIVNTPTVPAAITPSIAISNTSAATSTVVSSGSSFSINVPPPTFTNTGQNIVTGTYPNFTVNTPTVPAAITPSIVISNTAAATSTVVSSGSSFSINVPPPAFTNTGQNIVTGTYPNYSVNTPTVAPPVIAISATAAAGPSVTSVGNSFNINVPPATFTNSGPTTISGTSPNFTVNSPTPVTYISGTGIGITSGSIISNTAPDITPTIALTATAAAGPSVSSTGSSFNINIPPVTTPSMYASGIASVSPATGYNFTVTVNQPTFAYSQTNGSLTSGTSSAFITPTLTLNGATLSSGPVSNSVNLLSMIPWSASGNSVVLTATNNFVGIGTTSPAFKLDILGTSGPRMRVFSQDGYFAGLLAKNNTHEYFVGIQADYESAGGVTSGFHIYDNTAGARRMVIDATGRMGIGSSDPLDLLEIGTYSLTQDNYVSLKTGGGNLYKAGLKLSHFNTSDGFTIESNETVNRLDFIRNAGTSYTVMSIDRLSGNIGIDNLNPHAPLHFSNAIVNRKIVLWEGANNDHQFYGFGINGATLRYQTDSPGADHVFFAATSSGTSDELFRIKGNGLIKMGSETGTGQGPNYPVGGGGMIVRRLYTTNITAGEIVARTPDIILERDGSNGGWRINNTGSSALSVCNCMGTNSSGAAVNVALNNLAAGVTQVYTGGQNIVFFHCMFGDPYFSVNGHITEVSLTRQATDYFWIGTVTSTYNQ